MFQLFSKPYIYSKQSLKKKKENEHTNINKKKNKSQIIKDEKEKNQDKRDGHLHSGHLSKLI